ncbi:MAG TPA: hypothetical protein VKY74_00790, partial [Chloroflexia bacterium]|nr:hypothetical protein [Chloroflexia bacterium]
VPEAPETSGSIFAKARKRKEELEQTLRREAEARGEVYQPTPAAAPALPPEEAAELTYWPSLEEDVASPAPEATPVQPFDFNALGIPSTVDVAQDMASLQLSPFEFGDESHAPALAPSAGAGPPSLLQDTGTPTVEFSVPTGDSPAAAPTTAQVPAAPEPAAPSTAGELLWSIPVTGSEPAAAPAAGATGLDAVDHGFGEEVAPGQFDFTGLPQIDLGSLDLTPEERAYLMGEPGAAADMTTAELPAAAGVPELSLMDTDLTSASTAPIQPFSFDPAAFEAPAPAADATAGTAAAMAEATDTGPAAVQPFSFAEEPAAGPEAVQPFSFAEEPTAGPEAVQPFSFDIPAGPEEAAVQPFSFDRPAAPALSTPLPAATPPEPRFHIDTPPAPPPTPFGAAAGEVSPLAAESWAETPGAGAFDFSGVQMEPLAAETETTAAATPAVEAEAAPSRPVPTTPPAAIAPAAPPAARAVEPVAPVAATPAPAAPAAVPAPPPLAATPAPPVLASGSMDDLLRQLKENPTDAATRLALAIGYEQRDDYPRAAEQYRELIKGRTVPTNVLDIVTGNLRELVESQAENPTLHRLLGDAYMKQGLFQMAISQYNWLLTKGVR